MEGCRRQARPLLIKQADCRSVRLHKLTGCFSQPSQNALQFHHSPRTNRLTRPRRTVVGSQRNVRYAFLIRARTLASNASGSTGLSTKSSTGR